MLDKIKILLTIIFLACCAGAQESSWSKLTIPQLKAIQDSLEMQITTAYQEDPVDTKLVESLPKEFKSSLPTIKEIEAELAKQDFLSGKKSKLLKGSKKK